MKDELAQGGGWRAGKPLEDPEKLKRWGYITAKPSEYLVHVRKGKVLTGSSGQGASCFKWPRDAVAIVPTSLQQLRFRADQVTLERVGVEVVGLAVYRIAEPLLAYRVLNFSYPERAQQKLEETLTAMFMGAARRLVANLSIDECLQKRKSALAEELQREIAPVVGGHGRAEDGTEQGWGVVIDTIEIQEVKILSDKVFAAMQAPFRASLDQRAREAKALADKEIAAREAQFLRETELARLDTEAALRERRTAEEKAQAEEQAQVHARRTELGVARQRAERAAELAVEEAKLATERALRERRTEDERALAEARARDEVRRSELSALEAEAELAALLRKVALVEEKARAARAAAQLDMELRRGEAELRMLEGQQQAEVARLSALAERERAEAQARVLAAQNLPQLAAAVGQRISEVRILHTGQDNPFGSIAQAIHAVVDLAHGVTEQKR